MKQYDKCDEQCFKKHWHIEHGLVKTIQHLNNLSMILKALHFWG